MKLWKWFCNIGVNGKEGRRPSFMPADSGKKQEEDGTAAVCTRLCGNGGCRCGSTMRGLHCVWSHYRPSK